MKPRVDQDPIQRWWTTQRPLVAGWWAQRAEALPRADVDGAWDRAQHRVLKPRWQPWGLAVAGLVLASLVFIVPWPTEQAPSVPDQVALFAGQMGSDPGHGTPHSVAPLLLSSIDRTLARWDEPPPEEY